MKFVCSATNFILGHDMDAFRSLFAPEQEPRSRWYKAMSGRILRGSQKAAVVFYISNT